MNEAQIIKYLLQYAPIEKFYVFAPHGSALLKYFDSKGKAWSVMEDDQGLVERAAAYLRAAGAKVFGDHVSLMEHEQETSSARD